MVTLPSLLWGNTAYCVKLSGEDSSRYSNKTESVGLRNVRIITITGIDMVWRNYMYVTVTLCILPAKLSMTCKWYPCGQNLAVAFSAISLMNQVNFALDFSQLHHLLISALYCLLVYIICFPSYPFFFAFFLSFPLLFFLSFPLRTDLLHFHTGGRKRRPNLGFFSCFSLFYVIVFLHSDAWLFLFC